MRQTKLVCCIECGGDECFIWKFPPTLTCRTLRSSLAFNLMALEAYLQSFEKYLFLRLLKRVVLLGFHNLIVLTGLGLFWRIVGPSYTSCGSHWMISSLRASSSHNNFYVFFIIKSNRIWNFIYIYIFIIILGTSKHPKMVRRNQPVPKYFVPLDKLKRYS